VILRRVENYVAQLMGQHRRFCAEWFGFETTVPKATAFPATIDGMQSAIAFEPSLNI